MTKPIPVSQQFTDEQKEEIKKLWESGKTQKEISEVYDVPRRTIGKLCKHLGLHRNHKEAQKSKFDPKIVEEVKKLRKHHTIQETVAIINSNNNLPDTSMSAVHRICTKYEILSDKHDFDVEAICKDYTSGLSLKETAEKHNTTIYIIKNILSKQFVNIRPPIMSGGATIKIKQIDLPEFVDSKEWFEEAYLKYGMSSIAKFIGKSVDFVSHRLAKYNIERLSISDRHTKFDKDMLVKLYNEFGSMSKVAKRAQCTIQTVKEALLSRGITPTSTSDMFSGEGNPFYGKEHDEETKKRCVEIGIIHGNKFWEDNPEYIEIVKQKNKDIWSDLVRREEQSKKITQLMLQGKCNAKSGKIDTRFGVLHFDSSYESGIIEYCENNPHVKNVERDFDLIEYEYGGQTRNFIPDFRIWLTNGDFIIVESKSDWYAKKEKERSKIMAGFATLRDKFMVVGTDPNSKRIKMPDLSKLEERINILLEPKDFNFDDLELREVDTDTYLSFYNAFHYMGRTGRRGYTIGAFLSDKLIAASTISSITRGEIAERHELTQSDVRELVRFCIHPDFHKKNFGSWFLSKVVKEYHSNNPNVKLLVSFADTTQGHIGSIYKAAGWKEDGKTRPSYHYEDKEGYRISKKAIWDQAKKLNISESEHASNLQYRKVKELPKLRFKKRLIEK